MGPRRSCHSLPDGRSKADRLYAIVTGSASAPALTLRGVRARPSSGVTLLGGGPVRWKQRGEDLLVALDAPPSDCAAHAFRIPLSGR